MIRKNVQEEKTDKPRLTDTEGISKLLYVSPPTIHRWIKGGMPHLQAVKGGKLLYDIDKVAAWLVDTASQIESKIQKIRRINHAI